MKYNVSSAVKASTVKCTKGFRCLAPGTRGGRNGCAVDCADGRNVLFLVSNDGGECPYRIDFGSGQVCTCPTNYAIHRGGATPAPGTQKPQRKGKER